MGVPNEIELNDGYNGKKKYYYWSEYDTFAEALSYAKRIKLERKAEGIKIKYFILESQEGWFLPVPKFILYLNKNLRII